MGFGADGDFGSNLAEARRNLQPKLVRPDRSAQIPACLRLCRLDTWWWFPYRNHVEIESQFQLGSPAILTGKSVREHEETPETIQNK
jgi:hypothetical protein